MSEQLIISVSREYGSGGHEIAQKLAEYYKLPMYDHNLLDEVAASMNVRRKELAEFFVIVRRCSEFVLNDNLNLPSIFVLGDKEAKIERIMQIYELDARHAEERMIEKDRRRKSYHNSHCKVKWGDSRNYDLSINSSKLGVEETVESLKNYIDARLAHK